MFVMTDAGRFYEEAKYWAPILGVGGLLYKGISFFTSIRDTLLTIRENDLKHMHSSLSDLDRAMNNHTEATKTHLDRQTDAMVDSIGKLQIMSMAAIKDQTKSLVEELKESRRETVDILKDVRDDGKTAASLAKEVKEDLKDYQEQIKTDLKAHQDVDVNVQGYILSGIEVLKDRLEQLHKNNR